MATRSSILAWRIPGTEKPSGLPHGVTQSRTRLKRLSSSSKNITMDPQTPHKLGLPLVKAAAPVSRFCCFLTGTWCSAHPRPSLPYVSIRTCTLLPHILRATQHSLWAPTEPCNNLVSQLIKLKVFFFILFQHDLISFLTGFCAPKSPSDSQNMYLLDKSFKIPPFTMPSLNDII